MELSIFVARVAAVGYLAFAMGIMVNRTYYEKTFKHIMNDRTYMLLGGFLSLVIGILLIQHHNIWDGSWAVLVTLIGWIATIKGILLLTLPNSLHTFDFMVRPKNLNAVATFTLILGLLFGYFGFLT